MISGGGFELTIDDAVETLFIILHGPFFAPVTFGGVLVPKYYGRILEHFPGIHSRNRFQTILAWQASTETS